MEKCKKKPIKRTQNKVDTTVKVLSVEVCV